MSSRSILIIAATSFMSAGVPCVSGQEMLPSSIGPSRGNAIVAYASGQEVRKAQTVIIMRAGVHLWDGDLTQRRDLALLKELDYKVVDTREGRLWVRQDGREGWIDTDAAALPEKAVEDLTDRIQSYENMRPRPKNSSMADAYARRGWAWALKAESEPAYYENARLDLERATILQPTSAGYLVSLGNVHKQHGDNQRDEDKAKDWYHDAVFEYDGAIAVDRGNAVAWRNKGYCQYMLGKYDYAIDDYVDALRFNPKDSMTYYYLGLARCMNGIEQVVGGDAKRVRIEYQLAINAFKRATDLDGKFAAARSAHGLAWNYFGDYDRAIHEIDEAINLFATEFSGSPSQAESIFGGKLEYAKAYFRRGLAWSNKLNMSNAISDFEDAIRLEPHRGSGAMNRDLTWFAQPHMQLGLARTAQANKSILAAGALRRPLPAVTGEYDKAVSDYKKSIDLDPKFMDAYKNLISLLLECPIVSVRNELDACGYALQAAELTAYKDCDWLDLVARCLSKIDGNQEQALEWQKAADECRSSQSMREHGKKYP